MVNFMLCTHTHTHTHTHIYKTKIKKKKKNEFGLKEENSIIEV